MDYYSRLGPIDPQVPSRNGPWVPALGYLRQWEALLEKDQQGTLTTSELQVLLSFDQAELYMYEQAEQQSIALLEEWLVKYKFKNWTKTETQGSDVTESRRKARAVEIAKILNDTDRWHSHGHGISMEVLKRDLKLKIDDLADYSDLYSGIRGCANRETPADVVSPILQWRLATCQRFNICSSPNGASSKAV